MQKPRERPGSASQSNPNGKGSGRQLLKKILARHYRNGCRVDNHRSKQNSVICGQTRIQAGSGTGARPVIRIPEF